MFTSHGHHIPGTDDEGGAPPVIAQCGGPSACYACGLEVARSKVNPVSDKNRKGSVDLTETILAKREANRNRVFPTSEIIYRFGRRSTSAMTDAKDTDISRRFMEFAIFLDEILPQGRVKSIVFTELETTQMWVRKALSEADPPITAGP